MRQAEIDAAVARATGEPMDLVRGMGFNIIPMPRLVCVTPISRRHQRQAIRRRRRPRVLSAPAAVAS
jgi:hypothetical protein